VKTLVIDDERSLLKLVELGLTSNQCEVLTAETGAQGIDIFRSKSPDAIVCDLGLPDIDGIEVLKKIRELNQEIPIIMITAHGSIQTAISAMKLGAYDYVQKPFELEELQMVLDRAVREHQLLKDYERLRTQVESEYNFSNIIGSSAAMKSLFDRLRKASDTKSTVLIHGESGTGKELIARALHFNSSRRKKPLVIVDCGSIPNNLIESELFGHVRGAFTGADSLKKGLCEEAHQGTLFLDEIGELPLELQAKLLRFLQESTIRRVGDTQATELDVRVIAATNRDLEQEVKEKRFRQDLFYRLNVVPLRAPPLRERREDIAPLSHHFLRKYAQSYHRAIERIDPVVLQRLCEYSWPGNVRQLENIIEQMVVMTEGSCLRVDSLPPPLSQAQDINIPPIAETEWDLKKALQKVQAYQEEFMIRRALERTENNKTKAAELLGISRRALIYKAQEYRIEAASSED
jgi:two-component system response regulator AtoC